MRVLSADPACYLVELADLELEPPPERIRDHLEPLARIAGWARDYLCNPHPDLGREGPVCPYAELAMRQRLLFLTVYRGADLSRREVKRALLKYRDWFGAIEPREGNDALLKTILILFPDLAPEEVPVLIDGTQAELRPDFVAEGLMVGEFHSGPPPKPGLWNPRFRPLASPVPMLVIRHMVPTDFAFLKGDRRLVASYLERYGEQIPAHIREEVREVARGFGIPLPAPEEMAGVHPRVAQVLRRHRVPAVVHRHHDLPLEVRGPQDVARALGYPIERITKSLFFRAGGGRYAVVVCSVNQRVDERRVARRLGVERLELASLQELSARLGFSPGGVSPIAAGDIPVLMDEGLLDFPTVLTAAGEVRVEIEVDPSLLREITGADVGPLTVDDEERR